MSSEDPRKFLLDTVPVYVAYIDAEERYCHVNARYGELFGHDKEFVGRRVKEVVGPETYARVKPYLAQALSGRRTTHRYWLRSGEIERYFHAHYIPHIVDGRIEGLAVCGIDATEEQLAQEALEASEARFRSVFENATSGIVISELDATITAANEFACELFGYEESALLGMNALELIHPTDRDMVREKMQGLLAGKRQRAEVEHRFRARDGSSGWLHASFALVGGSASDSRFFLAVLTDVTAHKRAEEALQELTDVLESKVAERTSELTEVNNELDAFNHTVSHDLRAPLRALSGFTEALREEYGDSLDPTAQRYIERIAAASRNIGELLDGLLVLSNSSRQEMRKTRVDLSALANRSIAALQAETPDRKVQTHVQPGIEVNGDERLLEVLVFNLLSNAWKYTRNEPHPYIEVSAQQGEGVKVVCVSDNGAGFDQAHVDKAFAPFQRLHPSGEFEGQGIGLATVKRIVRRHGGRIWAESEPGQGATFMVALPN